MDDLRTEVHDLNDRLTDAIARIEELEKGLQKAATEPSPPLDEDP